MEATGQPYQTTPVKSNPVPTSTNPVSTSTNTVPAAAPDGSQRMRVFAVVAPAGVAYRMRPIYNEKNTLVKGPDYNDIVFATLLVKGDEGVIYGQCESGHGWLPLSRPPGAPPGKLLDEVVQPGTSPFDPTGLAQYSAASGPAAAASSGPEATSGNSCSLQSSTLPTSTSAADSSSLEADNKQGAMLFAQCSQSAGWVLENNFSGDSLTVDRGHNLAHETAEVEPAIWNKYNDPATGRDYWHNNVTNETTWNPPQQP